MERYREIECSSHYEVKQDRISHDYFNIEKAYTAAWCKSFNNNNPVTVSKIVCYEIYLDNAFLGIKHKTFPLRTYKNGR